MDPVVRDILDAAVDEFAEHGLAGARVQAIAERTRTSKRMLYYHFTSKEGLYAAALSHAYAQARGGLAEPDYAGLAPQAALRRYAGHVFDVHLNAPRFVRLVMGENLLNGRTIADAEPVRRDSQHNLAVLAGILQRGVADGSLRADLAPLDVYATLVGLSFHFVSNRATFSALFEAGADPTRAAEHRRAVVVDTIERLAAA